MDIAALSMALATSQVQTEVSVALASKAQDVIEQDGANLVKLMEQSVNPDIGGNVDIKT